MQKHERCKAVIVETEITYMRFDTKISCFRCFHKVNHHRLVILGRKCNTANTRKDFHTAEIHLFYAEKYVIVIVKMKCSK